MWGATGTPMRTSGVVALAWLVSAGSASADALATYEDGEGYLLDFRRAPTLGYNLESLTAYSTVLGWKLTSNLRLRAEYTHTDIEVVRGVTDAIRDAARNADSFAVEVGASF